MKLPAMVHGKPQFASRQIERGVLSESRGLYLDKAFFAGRFKGQHVESDPVAAGLGNPLNAVCELWFPKIS